MSDDSRNKIISYIIEFVFGIISAYIISLGLINIQNLNIILIIVAGLVIIFIIWGLQSKINKIEEDSKSRDLEIKKLNEKLKIQEQLIDMKADIEELKRYLKNGKK